LLDLQQTAGNQAVQRLAKQGAPAQIQRHVSPENAQLGERNEAALIGQAASLIFASQNLTQQVAALDKLADGVMGTAGDVMIFDVLAGAYQGPGSTGSPAAPGGQTTHD
jgi:hypothetical protein